MADSDHWVLYHSASRVCLCVRIFHIRPKLRVRLEEQPASHQSSFRHYTTWLNFLPVRGSFPNPCTVNPNLHPPCGCLPNRRSSFLTAGKKRGGRQQGLAVRDLGGVNLYSAAVWMKRVKMKDGTRKNELTLGCRVKSPLWLQGKESESN